MDGLLMQIIAKKGKLNLKLSFYMLTLGCNHSDYDYSNAVDTLDSCRIYNYNEYDARGQGGRVYM